MFRLDAVGRDLVLPGLMCQVVLTPPGKAVPSLRGGWGLEEGEAGRGKERGTVVNM